MIAMNFTSSKPGLLIRFFGIEWFW